MKTDEMILLLRVGETDVSAPAGVIVFLFIALWVLAASRRTDTLTINHRRNKTASKV